MKITITLPSSPLVSPPIVTIASEGLHHLSFHVNLVQYCCKYFKVRQKLQSNWISLSGQENVLRQPEWRSRFDQSLIKVTLSFRIQCNHIKNPLLPTMTTPDFFNDNGGYRNYCEGWNSLNKVTPECKTLENISEKSEGEVSQWFHFHCLPGWTDNANIQEMETVTVW